MRRTIRVALALCAVATIVTSAPHARGREERAPVSSDLARLIEISAPRVRAIVVGAPGDLLAALPLTGLLSPRTLGTGVVVEGTAAEIDALRDLPGVSYITLDLPVGASMALADRAVGGDRARAGTSGLLGIGSLPARSGKGIGVAVVDSGIAPHAALQGKVAAAVSFVTGDPDTSDGYGHGTHVAGIIAGLAGPASKVTSEYKGGIAPGAHLVNVRVLGDRGTGYTSDVIAGIEWVIANRGAYNIRIVNLSLGRPVRESCLTDPLCQAVGRAVSAGLLVVASAGNYGLDATGAPTLGGITSPGNSPFALTVAAINTQGTAARGDDTVTTYSSRGPTAFDVGLKPDVAAPGNRIVSLAAAHALLTSTYTSNHVAGSGPNAYARMSGTSMAAAVVSGGAALLLEGAPRLSPLQVKLALQVTSTFLPREGLMAAGAGEINLLAARQVAESGLSLPLPSTSIAGQAAPSNGLAFWDAGTLAPSLASGVALRLLDPVTTLLAWANVSLLRFGDMNVFGLLNPVALIPANRLLWGDRASWTGAPSIQWGDVLTDPFGQNVVWGNRNPAGQNVVWGNWLEGDNIVWGNSYSDDNIVWGNGMPEGDNIVWGNHVPHGDPQ